MAPRARARRRSRIARPQGISSGSTSSRRTERAEPKHDEARAGGEQSPRTGVAAAAQARRCQFHRRCLPHVVQVKTRGSCSARRKARACGRRRSALAPPSLASQLTAASQLPLPCTPGASRSATAYEKGTSSDPLRVSLGRLFLGDHRITAGRPSSSAVPPRAWRVRRFQARRRARRTRRTARAGSTTGRRSRCAPIGRTGWATAAAAAQVAE